MLIDETCREMNIKKEIKNPKDLLMDPILGEFLEELSSTHIIHRNRWIIQYMNDKVV